MVRKRRILVLIIIHTAAAVGLLLSLYMLPRIFSGCVFRQMTGIPCPGCGLTRAAFSLLHLDLTKAWYYNPSIFFFPTALLLSIHLRLFKHKKPILILILLLFVAVVATYFIRLFFFRIP